MNGAYHSASAWFSARASLNHDLLANRILVALGAARDKRQPPIDLRPFLRLFLVRAPEIVALLDEAERALLPSRWIPSTLALESEPLLAAAVSAFLDLDFLATSSIPNKCRSLTATLEATICTARAALDQGDKMSETSRRELENLVREVSNGISELPGSFVGILESMW